MSKKPTIVLLEDDRVIRDLMVDGLTEYGYVSVPTETAEAMETELSRLDGNAILVADREVGGTNGFEVAGAALERFPGLRVIYVSGTHLAVRRRQLSPRERSLLKPFAITQLISLVKQLA